MRALQSDLRRQLEAAVLAGRRAAEAGVRAALSSLGVQEEEKPAHLDESRAQLRRGLRAKQRHLGGEFEVLLWECAYEQWHRLLFARFLAENGLLQHPEFGVPVTLAECEELAADLGEPDGWTVAGRFAAEILPGIFRLDDPCVQLRLAPEHRVALEKIIAGLPHEVFVADDSLGWVYQYWQKVRKAEIRASEVKIGGADLATVTQLFTENYMVRFLLENSLGAWWAARHPGSPLIKEFEFLRFDEDGRPAATFDGWPDRAAEITVIDPYCGSGHFLVEAFGMLWRMRAEEEGLDPVAAQDAVLQDNLFGLELDPRCVQIAMFAAAMTAWKQAGGWRELPTPHIACSGIPAKAPLEEWTALADGDYRLEHALERLHALFRDADTLGSLIDPRRAAEMVDAAGSQRSFDDVDFDEIAPLLEKAAGRETRDPATAVLGADAVGIARAADLLSRSYSLVVTNVPWLKRGHHVEELARFCKSQFPEAQAELATVALERCIRLLHAVGTIAVVSPQNWLTLGSFRRFRERMLREQRWHLVARLGASAFETISGEVVKPALTITSTAVDNWGSYVALVGDDARGVAGKIQVLRYGPLLMCDQSSELENPDSRITFTDAQSSPPMLLADIATGVVGIQTSDDPRYRFMFWEVQVHAPDWELMQDVPTANVAWDGCSHIVRWEQGRGSLVRAEPRALQGQSAWGRPGVVVARFGQFFASLYLRGKFHQNAAVIVPTDPSLVSPILTFCQSTEFETLVRKIDQKKNVTNASLVKVPFELERWQQDSDATGPLPEPWSDDPTQWLFQGGPEVSTEPLQVAVGRLVGYRWPEQSESDDLNSLADRDGIVCLPAVAREQPGAERLQTLLARAYGVEWTPGRVRELLEKSGSRKTNLADWLRDDFFKHHCRVFANRPFVWHIWDRRKDGFSALVNYHRLDRAGLEKLTYTYLGDWIERQRADAFEDVTGADVRLAAARELKGKLEAILEGEPPYDIYVRWKDLHEQPIGWEPDLDDGVRLNIRPFVEAGVLRAKVNVHWRNDRGKNPDWSERRNDRHYTIAEKRDAREKARHG